MPPEGEPFGAVATTSKGRRPCQCQSYLFLDGRCEEAIEFYKKTLGAKVEMMMRFKENPEPQPGMCAPGTDEQDHALVLAHRRHRR